MVASVVEICCRALDHLGQPPILSLEDPTKTAAACSRGYPISRDAVLRAYPWNCATRRASLAALTTAPAWGYGRQFQLPNDCLRVLETEGDLSGTTWRREGNLILTDEAAPLRVRYIAQVTDPAQFDALLVDAIAAHLAGAIGYAVTGSGEAVQRAMAIYERVLTDARKIDARESSQDETLVDDSWLVSRLMGARPAARFAPVPSSPAPGVIPTDPTSIDYGDY
jgi:hypothetical protein